jgi:hypothetical protein
MKRVVPKKIHLGFAYIGLLIVIALINLSASYSLSLGVISDRRQAEVELLWWGENIARAIESYASINTGALVRHPQSLEHLVRDPRYPEIRRYLRRIPVDPMTGRNEWGVIRAPDGGIAGVYSLSTLEPIKKTRFDPGRKDFEQGKTYQDWRFIRAGLQVPR